MYRKAAAFQLGLLSSTFTVNIGGECKASVAAQRKRFSVRVPQGWPGAPSGRLTLCRASGDSTGTTPVLSIPPDRWRLSRLTLPREQKATEVGFCFSRFQPWVENPAPKSSS